MNKLLGGVSPLAMILRNAEGSSGAAGGEGGDGGTKPAESILFPDDAGTKPDDKPADGGAGDPPKADADKAAAGDWKEYENDPAKSEAENAAAKAEHDKTKPAGEGDKDKKDDPADTVPEDGKYTLTMPEGVEVDAELLDAVSPRFKELGLTTKQAQALTDDFVKLQQKRAEDYAGKPEGQWSMASYTYFKEHGTPDTWADKAKADDKIGGTNWDGTVKDSRRAVDRLGTPELREYLNRSGGGNHPELIRFMARVGSMIKEDNPAAGGAEGAGKPVEAAHRIFPNDAPKG